MTMNTWYISRFLAALLLLVSGLGCDQSSSSSENPRAPNIVVIMTDDMGYGDISAFQSGWIHTPSLERLAEEGMTFTDFHAASAVCSPTRASLLTGRYQQRAGIPGVIYASRDANRHHGLRHREFTLAELAKKADYETGIFGKWHLGYRTHFNPIHHGFDQFRGYVSGNVDYISHVDGIGVHDWWQDTTKIEEEGYTTDLINTHAIDFVRSHRSEPFLLYIAHEAPHRPFQAPGDPPIRRAGEGRVRTPPIATGDTTYIRSRYRTMVQEVDEGIGALINTLEKLDIADRTLVFFFSDNGPLKPWGSPGPLRGWKGSLLEGGHRVPAFAWWPGRIEGGSVSSALTSTLDILPTVGDLIGAAPPDSLPPDGRSLLPVLFEDSTFDDRQLFWEYDGQQAMREGPWKLVLRGYEATVNDSLIVREGLFNLNRDLSEQNDLSSTYPERAARMKRAIESWDEEVTQDATPQPAP